MTPLIFGSVCSGIEAASVAWHPLGMRAAWFSEIESFPCSVLKHHYPSVPNVGDMRLIARAILTREVPAPDVLVGGTPCQAFSLAGLREALDDERGQLTLTYMRLLNAIDFIRGRDGKQPAIAVWENVPGVLNAPGNAFGCFLAGLAGETQPLIPTGKKWPNAGCVFGPQRAVAWRTIDAQYVGLAQRRKRVFVVASARKGFDPSAILFEFGGVRRDSAPSREQGAQVAALTANGVGTCGADDNQAQAGHLIASTGDVAHCLNAGGMGRQDYETETLIAQAVCATGERTHCLTTRIGTAEEDGTGRGAPIVPYPLAFPQNMSGTQCAATEDLSPSLCAKNPTAICFTDTRGESRGSGIQVTGDIANTLHCAKGISEQQAVCVTGDITHTLKAEGFDASEDGTGRGQPITPHGYGVRRLLPVECERLQGFPDGYTDVPHRGKPAADGPRYKALGNSMAVPVMRWIGSRIQNYLAGNLPRGFL